MNIRFLESFLYVVEEGSVVSAARRLHLTATAVAQRIKALENELDVTLLSRTGQTMKATPAGLAILPKARDLIAGCNELKQLANFDKLYGNLRIGILPTLLSMLVPDAIYILSKNYPQLIISLKPGFSYDLYKQILQDQIDLALLVSPAFPLAKELCWRSHHSEKFVVIASANLKEHDSIELLHTRPFIQYHQYSWGGIVANKYLQSLGIEVKKFLEINTTDAIISLVTKGYGISLIPDYQSLHEYKNKIIKHPLPEPSPERNIGLLYKYNSPLQHLIKPVVRQLLSHLNS